MGSYLAEAVMALCAVTADPQHCESYMYECENITSCELPDHPIDGVLEICIESYKDPLEQISQQAAPPGLRPHPRAPE